MQTLMTVPVPTYFTLGQHELPGSIQRRIEETGGEVVENLVFLGELGFLIQEQANEQANLQFYPQRKV